MRRHPTMDIFIAQRLLLVGIDSCWVYPGRRDRGGYAKYSKSDRAHRVAYTVMHGDPLDKMVCHTCDNRPCANPFHLYAGTAADNMRDKLERTFNGRGEQNPSAKLTTEQVLAIRIDARPQTVIAAEYGIRQTTVSEIKNGHLWGHL